MLKVGITGGIGSGKTTVCRIFESMSIPVYYADDRAKELMYRSKKLKSSIKKLLGPEAYHSNGRPNRKVIASKIFSDKKLLQGINALVHPAVYHDGEEWFASQSSKYCLKEAALLIESNSYKQLDKLIVVSAPKEMRIQRVMKRDNISAEAVSKRIANQLPEKDKVSLADYVIDNSGKESLIKQIWALHKELTRAANKA